MNILEIKHLHKSYEKHKALDDVSLNIPRQKIFGLLGPNGAGKTTLIRIITQIIAPDAGEILFNQMPLSAKHVPLVGYLPEERGLYKKMKVGEQLLYLAQLKGLSKQEATAKIKHWVEKLDIKSWWNKKIEDLSKGMQQKVQFIATVLHQPPLIILDEPFSGFDPVNANLIKDEILELKAQGSTIIFSTHRMESVEELCDHIALIHKSKKILDGATQEIKQRYKTHTYKVNYQGNLTQLALGQEVVESKQIDETHIEAIIKIPVDMPSNQLLQTLIQQVEVKAFQENLPTMNDIFITHVTEKPL